MIEIYIYSSVGAIPFTTMTNREWGQIGNNYLRGLVALGFQGFFIMICVGIYAVLVNSFTVTTDIHATIFSIAAYTVRKAGSGVRPRQEGGRFTAVSLQTGNIRILSVHDF